MIIVVYGKLKDKSIHKAKLQYLFTLLEKPKCDPYIFCGMRSGVNENQTIAGKKGAVPMQNEQGEKSSEIQGGSQELVVVVV